MAKKKKGINNRVVGGIIGAVVVLVVVVPVLFFVLGIGNDDVLPQSTNPQLEIPFDESVNEELRKLIQEIISDPSIPTVCDDDNLCEREDVNKMVEEAIEKITDPPPVNNQTKTSDDPPIVQICDQEPENILCQVTQVVSTLRLESVVTKIDSTGLSTSDLGVFEIPSLAFLVEDPTDRDFRTGFLEITLRILSSDEGSQFDVIGTFDVLINNQTVLSEPITIQTSGIIDSSGGLTLSFLSPTGQPSSILAFSFDEHFNTFIDDQVNIVEFQVIQLDITRRGNEQFSITNQTIFSIDINKDPNRIIITDEVGEKSRIYPTDSRLIINSVRKAVIGGSCAIGIGVSGAGLSFGKFSGTFPEDCLANNPPETVSSATAINSWRNNYPISSYSHGNVPAPEIIGIILLDSSGQLVTNQVGGTGKVFDNLITRNANYSLIFSSPSVTNTISFGKSQETQSYTCFTEGTPIFKVSVGTQLTTVWYYLIPNGIRTGAFECNIP